MAQASAAPDEQRMSSFAFYHSVIRDPQATVRDKLLARKRIDKLLGLEQRDSTAPRNDEQEREAVTALSQMALQDPEARELLARLTERLGGLDEPEQGDGTDAGEELSLPDVFRGSKAG
jgi:hypothetical protein